MSSAILYLAIIAIWACVLIPRWLRRDSAHGVSAAPPLTSEPPVPAEPDATADFDMGAGEADDGSLEDADADDDAPRPIPAHVPEPLSAEESRRRMLAARRRLLLMLIGLEAAAIALAYLGLAALWVVIPPSIMLAGYLLLLREAARADAERAEHEAEAAAHAQAREHARERALAARRATPADGMSAEGIAAAALAARFAAAPVPADYEDSGRDFAPGLAGKYTPSTAAASNAPVPTAPAEATDEDYYSAYETPRLRAVGD
jgi:hypothetical protein